MIQCTKLAVGLVMGGCPLNKRKAAIFSDPRSQVEIWCLNLSLRLEKSETFAGRGTFKLEVVQMSLRSLPELLRAELSVAITTLDLSQDQNLLFPP